MWMIENLLPKLAAGIQGKLFGDKGYLSNKLFKQLYQKKLVLITTIKKNMKNKLMPLLDRILLKKRFLIETINDLLKNLCQIEHSRHRSPINFMVHLTAGLAAYTHLEKKPKIKWPPAALIQY